VRILIVVFWTVGLSRVRSMATEQFSSTAPIKFGPYAVKFTVQPEEGTAAPTHRPLTDDFLSRELIDRLRKEDLVLDFMVQFYVDDTHTPIENTSVRWREKYAPKWKVAQLRIPRCDLDDPQSREQSAKIDKLSFSPWHATEDHRPLGNVMRARRVAYEASAGHRDHSPEPRSIPL
jgi:catalase